VALVFHLPTSDTIIQFSGVLIALGIIYRYIAKPIVSAAKDLAESAEAHKKYGKTLADIALEFQNDEGSSLKDVIDMLTVSAADAKAAAESVAKSLVASKKEALLRHKAFENYVQDKFHGIENSLTVIQGAALTDLKKRAKKAKR